MKVGVSSLVLTCMATLLWVGCSSQNPLLRSQPYNTPKNFQENWQVVDSMVKSGSVNLQQADETFRHLYGKNLTVIRVFPYDNECVIHDLPTQQILVHIKSKLQFEQFLRHLIKDEDFIARALNHYRGPVLALGREDNSWTVLFFDKKEQLIEAFGRATVQYE
jgi:hypothetical protein